MANRAKHAVKNKDERIWRTSTPINQVPLRPKTGPEVLEAE
jgi:hypothetical protein